MTKLKLLDLFSGIGGFSLGLERTGGFETVAFCEYEEARWPILNKHWPNTIIYKDVKEINGKELTRKHGQIDVITGGFPCQDLSVCGHQRGIEAERSGLWSEIVRLVSEIRPGYVIVENVANLLSGPSEKPGAWFGRILSDLASIGYDAEWENIPASALGAPHRRERVWIVAYPSEKRLAGQIYRQINPESFTGAFPRTSMLPPVTHGMGDAPDSFTLRGRDGFSEFMGQLNAYGNAIVPQIAEITGNAILETEKLVS
jgi:DNA (cytosine-5)-methyltransferase 1